MVWNAPCHLYLLLWIWLLLQGFNKDVPHFTMNVSNLQTFPKSRTKDKTKNITEKILHSHKVEFGSKLYKLRQATCLCYWSAAKVIKQKLLIVTFFLYHYQAQPLPNTQCTRKLPTYGKKKTIPWFRERC